MTVELQDQFGGIAPAISEKKLSPQLATLAENVRFEGGKLRPWRGLFRGQPVGSATESLFYRNQTDGWLFSDTPRDYVRPFMPADALGFTHFTDGAKPRYLVAGSPAEYDVALPPVTVPSATILDVGDDSNPLLMRRQSYVLVWVDGHGRVSRPSLASNSVDVGEGSTVRVNLPPAPVGNYYTVGAVWRIFRSNAGTQGIGSFQFVDEVADSETQYDDSFEPDELTYTVFSDTWEGPPDGMEGLVMAPGGVLLGYTANEVYASEPNVPYAWPYSWGFQEQVRGLAVIQGGVLVVTDGSPWLLVGSQPINMQPVRIESDAFCVSPRSLVDMGDMAIYASKDGLYAAQGSTVVNLMEGGMDEDSWAAYQPETIRGFKYENFYIGVYGAPNDGTAFVFDYEARAFVTLTGLNMVVGAHDPWTNEAYVIESEGANRYLSEFDAGDVLLGRWRSRTMMFPNKINFSALRLEADIYEIGGDLQSKVLVWSDTNGWVEVDIEDGLLHKLPAGFKARRWQFEIQTQVGVDTLCLASSAGLIV